MTKLDEKGAGVEEIARIIDPHSFLPDNSGDDLIAEMVRQGQEDARDKATRILSAIAAWNRRPSRLSDGEPVAFMWEELVDPEESVVVGGTVTRFASHASTPPKNADVTPLYASPSLPPGHVVVPVEMTDDMYDAFFRARDEIFPEQMARLRSEGRGWKALPHVVWEAMLAALPHNQGGANG